METQSSRTKKKSYKLVLLQVAVIMASLLCMWVFIKATPIYYDRLVTECVFEECLNAPMPPTTTDELKAADLSPEAYALYFVIIDTLLVLYFYLAALFILWKCFKEPMGLLAAFMLVSFGSVFPSTLSIAGNIPVFFSLGWGTFVLFFMLFPNGKFTPKWTGIYAVFHICILFLGELFPKSSFNFLHMPLFIKSIFLLSAFVIMGFSQIYRFIKVSSSTERQQTKWVVYGFAFMLVTFISINLLYIPGVVKGPISLLFLNAIISASVAIIPTTLTFAVLKHRLWDIGPIVNRTIVYGVLTASTIFIYILSVSYLSRIFQTTENIFSSFIATGIVAVLFAPLKEHLQKWINRLMYGKKNEPFKVLTMLSQHWEKPISMEEAIDIVAKMIRESLKLPYAAISFTVDSRDTIVAVSGQASTEIISIPIIHRGETLGNLLLSPRSLGEEFSKADQELLEVLIRQAGPVIQGVKMSVGMKLLAEEVQESREKLVLAREEERRKLRRNLHDDLAPRLAALALNVAAAERIVKKDPATTADMLAELKMTIRSTVNDIRTLVHDLRPPTLDELGLVESIKQRVEELTKAPSHLVGTSLNVYLDVMGDIPSLPAAVEVAAYRIVTESLVNVIRHSSATACLIQLKTEDHTNLHIEVSDNGIGFEKCKPTAPNGGIGMQSMREQAVELGGKCLFESKKDGGMRVHAILPYNTGRDLNENIAG